MEKEQCKHCGSDFVKSPRHKNQKYCRASKCQKAKKAAWQRDKMHKDQEYRQNQKEYYAAWVEKNPDYWKKYRQRNPEKAKRNAFLQKARYAWGKAQAATKKRKMEVSPVAKMDASNSYPWQQGEFYLLPIIAKMDASNRQVFEISVKSTRYFEGYLVAKMDLLGKS